MLRWPIKHIAHSSTNESSCGHIKAENKKNVQEALSWICRRRFETDTHYANEAFLVLNFGWMWIVRTGFIISDGLLTFKQNAIKINFRFERLSTANAKKERRSSARAVALKRQRRGRWCSNSKNVKVIVSSSVCVRSSASFLKLARRSPRKMKYNWIAVVIKVSS